MIHIFSTAMYVCSKQAMYIHCIEIIQVENEDWNQVLAYLQPLLKTQWEKREEKVSENRLRDGSILLDKTCRQG